MNSLVRLVSARHRIHAWLPPHPSEFAHEVFDLTMVGARSSESKFLYLRYMRFNPIYFANILIMQKRAYVHALTLASAVGAVILQTQAYCSSLPPDVLISANANACRKHSPLHVLTA